MESFENAKNNAIDGKIYCHCVYQRHNFPQVEDGEK